MIIFTKKSCWQFALGAGLVTAVSLSQSAIATSTFCAVTERTQDGFVNLRAGPGPQYAIRAKAILSDFLFVATEHCRSDFGPTLCDENGSWVFVEKIFSIVPDGEEKRSGWVNARLIRQVGCPD